VRRSDFKPSSRLFIYSYSYQLVAVDQAKKYSLGQLKAVRNADYITDMKKLFMML
jgi:hypothetical protein